MSLRNDITEVGRQDRCCDICGSSLWAKVWSYSRVARARSAAFLWNVDVVICLRCGFCCVSPVPTENSLLEYYSGNFAAFSGQSVDYSVEKRLGVLDRFAPGERYVEIGASSNNRDFLKALRSRYRNIETVEVNDTASPTVRRVGEIERGLADVVCAYFVLEHVGKPVEFLGECASMLASTGRLVVEVPDIRHYGVDPVALRLHEHVNHFSPATLVEVARLAGLDLVFSSVDDCSRSFGFVSVFRLSVSSTTQFLPVDPPDVVKEWIDRGLELVGEFYSERDACRKRIAEASLENRCLIWGANSNSLDLFDGWAVPERVVVVDRDPRKRDFFFGEPVVMEPEDAISCIREAGIVIICSRRHRQEIEDYIEGVSDEKKTIIVLDINR